MVSVSTSVTASSTYPVMRTEDAIVHAPRSGVSTVISGPSVSTVMIAVS